MSDFSPSSKVGGDAKRACRDIDHHLEALGRDVDRHMHNAGKDFTVGETDTWSDVKDDYRHVGDSIHHVIDKL